MAQVKQGPLGNVSGKIGNISFSSWKEKTVVKGRPSKSKKPATQKQLEQRLKMAVANQFMRTIKEVVTLGYRDLTVKMTGYNASVRNLLKNALSGNHPDYTIDYSLVEICRGEIRQLFKADASSAKTDTVTFTWTTKSGVGRSRPGDKAILVAYCEAMKVSAYTVEGPPRSAGTADLELPGFSGQTVHTWVAFISEDRSDVSDSVYAGKVTLA
ncbi:DUF6266 family protein [Longitalea luteola]|uniref:DUF6266 family protein n=1 Tax=Longitalea luteola TaxID=2812563 RepID=UPI001A970975|nr:DUF6266 family protein [Longitalea luteola]